MPLTDDQLLERMNTRMSPSSRLLGMRLLELDSARGHVRIAFEAREDFCNPMGQVQGGFVSAMLDETAAIAGIAKAQTRISMPSLEFKVSFLSPARAGPLFTVGRVVRLGRTVAYLEADLYDPADKLLARMSVTALPLSGATPNLVERAQAEAAG